MADESPTLPINTNDLVGYRVVATDGPVGRVHPSTVETPLSNFVVETGHVFHHPHLVPSRVIADVDHKHRVVSVRLSKHELRETSDFLSQESFDLAVADEQDTDAA